MAIALTMLVMGMVLGFVGAGGSGFIIAILTVVFGVPIHTALGTSIAAMMFTALSGAISHFRKGNISVKTGLIVGDSGQLRHTLDQNLPGVFQRIQSKDRRFKQPFDFFSL